MDGWIGGRIWSKVELEEIFLLKGRSANGCDGEIGDWGFWLRVTGVTVSLRWKRSVGLGMQEMFTLMVSDGNDTK